MPDLLAALRQDYARFPIDQTFSLYAQDVRFKDPMTQFQGRQKYEQMVGLIARWFLDCRMELHDLQQNGNQIRSDWTLRWRSLWPGNPEVAISGWSELEINEQGLIQAHVDYWHCSRWQVFRQFIGWGD
jgi:hypothetical protein